MTTTEIVTDVPIPEYSNNLFISGLPPLLSEKDLQNTFRRPPLLEEIDPRRPAHERLHIVSRLQHYSQPTTTGRQLARAIEKMIYRGYTGRNPLTSDWMRMVQTCAAKEQVARHAKRATSAAGSTELLGEAVPMFDTSSSLLLFGPPGVGKTHSFVTSLRRFKQVLYHTTPFVLAQIVWLRVECPPTGSLTALCTFFFAAVDTALRRAGVESNLEDQYKRQNIGTMLAGMARVAALHAIGLLVIDEIQNVKAVRGENSELLNFLVTMQNTIGVPVLMVGTMSALSVVQRTFHDARRADGSGSIMFDRMHPAPPAPKVAIAPIRHGVVSEADAAAANSVSGADRATERSEAVEAAMAPAHEPQVFGAEFEGFVKRMWRYQYTDRTTPLSVPLLNAIYEETQGVTDLIIKLFMLVQIHLITEAGSRKNVDEEITPDLVRHVAREKFNAVRPYIEALRRNDLKALRNFNDLVDWNSWFQNYMEGIGCAEDDGQVDEDHGDVRLPPMIVAGSIDRSVIESIMGGFGIDAVDRERVVSRHASLIESGNLTGLIEALKGEVVAATAQGTRKREKLALAPPVDGDLRKVAEGAADAGEIARRLGLENLDDALLA